MIRVKIFETELFGPVVAPDEFWQIIELASLGECETKNIYLWRGQGNIAWPIHSSAYRRLEKDKTFPPSEITMRDYERELLLNAKHQGYHHENGRTLPDFELLAKLQHHGAATRLVDFSRNMLVALWFACNSESDKTGLLFGMFWAGVCGFEGRPELRTYNELFGSGDPKADDELENFPRLWQPPVVTRRIAAQSAQFLYSRVADERTGSLVLCENPNHLNMIAITPELKKKCLVLLESVFDIRQFTLFPDIDGFCYANSVSFESHSNERW
nr:FRG domain-containing protein [Enterobacter cloacae]